MTRDASEHSAEALRRQREQVRRALVRANTAGLAIMLVVLALALAAIALAFRSERHAGQAKLERRRAEDELWRASLAQARAQRLTGQMGQRVLSLEGVRAAARWRPSLAVREEALAALALPDLESESSLALLTNAVSVAVDAGFTRFASANDQGQAVVRRLADGALEATLTSKMRGAPSTGFSPDGSLLAIKLRQEFAVWRVATQERLWSVQDAPPAGWNRLPAFSADGALVVIPIRSGGLRIHEARTGRIRHVLPEAMVSGVLAFHPRTNWLAVGAELTVQVWDYEASKVVVSLPPRRNNVLDVTWRPDGRWLALGGDDGSAYLWNVRTGEEIACTGHSREGVRVGLRPQGDLLASYAWDSTLRVWDAGSGAQVLQTQLGEPLRFSANGERLAVFRRPNRLEILRVFPPRECRLLTLPPRSRSVLSALEFSPDSQHLAVGNHEGLWLWPTAAPADPIQGAAGAIDDIHFVAPDACLTSGSDGVRRWRWPVSSEVDALGWSSERLVEAGDQSGHSVLTADRKHLLVDTGSEAELLDLATGQRQPWLRGQSDMANLAASPDVRWFASGAWNNVHNPASAAWIWSAATGQPVHQLPTPNSFVAFSPDGALLGVGTPHDCRLLAVGTWQEVRRLTVDSASTAVAPFCFSPDGRFLALPADDRALRLVDLVTGRGMGRLTAPGAKRIGLSRFSPDGNWLAVAGQHDVQLWNLRLLRERLAELDLAWEVGDDLREGRARDAGGSARVDTRDGPTWSGGVIVVVVLAVGVALVLLLAWRRYQHGMLGRYLELDTLIAQRNEELAMARAELAHSQKMRALGTLAAGIAHDFNNLLSVIRMANRLSGEDNRDRPAAQEHVALIEKTVAQGKAVVRALLGSSRTAPARGVYSAIAVVEETLAMLRRQFLDGLQVRLDLDRNVPKVEGARDRVEEILFNLMVNAAEAMRGRGEIRLTVNLVPAPVGAVVLPPRAAGLCVQIGVADTGPGIPPAVRERIFEPFFTTKTVGSARGTGLGLSMVYTLAQEEGLGLVVETEPGRGTTFRVLIPVAP